MVKKCPQGLCRLDSQYPEGQAGGVRFVPFPKPHCNRETCLKQIKAFGRLQEQPNINRVDYNCHLCCLHEGPCFGLSVLLFSCSKAMSVSVHAYVCVCLLVYECTDACERLHHLQYSLQHLVAGEARQVYRPNTSLPPIHCCCRHESVKANTTSPKRRSPCDPLRKRKRKESGYMRRFHMLVYNFQLTMS